MTKLHYKSLSQYVLLEAKSHPNFKSVFQRTIKKILENMQMTDGFTNRLMDRQTDTIKFVVGV